MKIFIEPALSKYYESSPLVLIDVGASGGMEANWKSAEKYLKIIGFEPDERAFSELVKKEDGRIKYLNTGLYKEKKIINYYLLRKQQASSIFRPNREFLDKFPESERFDIMDNVNIKVDSLDTQFNAQGINEADFIKVDAQGAELFILQGAEETIRNFIFGVEVEVEFVEVYKGQPLFADVDSFLKRQGFQIFDIQGAYWKRMVGLDYHKKRGQLIFGNALYLRESEDFRELLNHIQDNFLKKCKALKAFSICFLYGYFDYAMEISYITKDLFDDSERKVIQEYIKHSKSWYSRIPEFKGRKKLADIFYYLWDILRPTHNKWATLDRKLGNL